MQSQSFCIFYNIQMTLSTYILTWITYTCWQAIHPAQNTHLELAVFSITTQGNNVPKIIAYIDAKQYEDELHQQRLPPNSNPVEPYRYRCQIMCTTEHKRRHSKDRRKTLNSYIDIAFTFKENSLSLDNMSIGLNLLKFKTVLEASFNIDFT